MAVFRGMDLGLSVEGIPETVRKLSLAPRVVQTASAGVVRGSALRIVLRAKALAPVDRGNLRRSITYRLQGTRGYVGCVAIPVGGGGDRGRLGPALYWRFVEFGTVHTPAQPFFRPAAESERGRFQTEMLWQNRNALAREIA